MGSIKSEAYGTTDRQIGWKFGVCVREFTRIKFEEDQP